MSKNSPPLDTMLLAIRKIIHASDQHSKKSNRETGLTTPQLLLLQTLANEPELSPGELAKKIMLSQATITNILQRLAQRGILNRTPHPVDKRRIILEITEKGHHALKYAPTALPQAFIHHCEKLPMWEQQALAGALVRIAELMHTETQIDTGF